MHPNPRESFLHAPRRDGITSILRRQLSLPSVSLVVANVSRGGADFPSDIADEPVSGVQLP